MPILCFLTVRPPRLFYEFCCRLASAEYPVFIVIDDNEYHILGVEDDVSLVEHVTILKVDKKECEAAGFKSTLLSFNGKATSRDTSLYYFCRKFTAYDYVWFIEEDVFVPTETSISNIDKKFPTGDLLVGSHKITNEMRHDWHWSHVKSQVTFPPPYACAMMCAIRVSRKLMKIIDVYAAENNDLFYGEALFNTLALRNDCTVIIPPALYPITYRRDWKSGEMNEWQLFHPVKDIEEQYRFREDLVARRREKETAKETAGKK